MEDLVDVCDRRVVVPTVARECYSTVTGICMRGWDELNQVIRICIPEE